MGILKTSVIGFMIICPFFFISFVQIQSDVVEQQQLSFIEKAIEEASYDAAFAMKTYSEFSYDSLQAYNIDIPHEDVIQVFFDSLSFRDFSYSKSDFAMLIFIEYDGLVIYNPKEDLYYLKVYYCEEQEDTLQWVNLNNEITTIDKDTSLVLSVQEDKTKSEKIILQTIETSMNRVALSLNIQDQYVFELPEFDHNYYSQAIKDLSFIALYSHCAYYELGNRPIFEIVPSGIMKMTDEMIIGKDK